MMKYVKMDDISIMELYEDLPFIWLWQGLGRDFKGKAMRFVCLN